MENQQKILGSWEYFCDEYFRFINAIGNRDIMTQPDIAMIAWGGLVYVALNTRERIPEVSRVLEVAHMDFSRRLTYMCGR